MSNNKVDDVLVEVSDSLDLWGDFFNDIWERSPKKYSSDESDCMGLIPPVTSEELFSMTCNHVHAASVGVFNSESRIGKIKFFNGGEKIAASGGETQEEKLEFRRFKHLFPQKTDNDFDEYNRRIKNSLDNKGANYILIIDELLVSPGFRSWIYGLLSQIYNSLGYIAVGSFISVFYGNYDKTPFGAHMHDNEEECEGAFFFSLKNEKKIRIWSRSSIKELMGGAEVELIDVIGGDTELTNYEEYNDYSDLHSVAPGETLYWPADAWHVAEDQASDVIAFPLAIRVAYDLTHVLYDYFRSCFVLSPSQVNFLDNQVEECFQNEGRMRNRKNTTLNIFPGSMQSNAEIIPHEVEIAFKVFKGVVPADEFGVFKVEFWLKLLSSYGFSADFEDNRDFDLGEKTITLTSHICLYKNVPLVYRKYKKTLIVASAGQSTFIDSPPENAIEKMVETLNEYKFVPVSKLVGTAEALIVGGGVDDFDSEYLLEILNRIARWGVFEFNN